MLIGEGGMVFARSGSDRDLVRQLRGQGMDPQRRYWHPAEAALGELRSRRAAWYSRAEGSNRRPRDRAS